MSRILTIFDFDDTLIKSHRDSQVRITHADGSTSSLPSDEYAEYVKKPGDVFDYSDFDKYPHGAVPIDTTFDAMRSALMSGHKVVVLTARGSWQPVKMYLEDNGFRSVNVIAVGDSNPQAKARYVIDALKRGNYEMVEVYEDNLMNIRAIKKVVTDNGVTFKSVKVTSNGEHIIMERPMRKSKDWRF